MSHCFGCVYCGYCEYSQCFEVQSADTSGLAAFRGSMLWVLSVLRVFLGFVLPVLQVLLYSYCSISPVGVASARSTKILAIRAVCSEYEVYFDHL